MKRYLTIVGIVLVVVLGLAFVLRPRGADLERDVNEAYEAYTAAGQTGGVLAPVDTRDSVDFLAAGMHTLKLRDGETFRCIGAFKVTVCMTPKELGE
jgi:hypothetical protein